MWKVILLIATAMLAREPIPSQALTITVADYYKNVGSIVRSTSVPTDRIIFDDEDEELYSITTANWNDVLCSVSMTN